MPRFPARRAEPGTTIVYHDRTDGEITLTADAEGVVQPRNEAEGRVADRYGLPVIRDRTGEGTDQKKETKR